MSAKGQKQTLHRSKQYSITSSAAISKLLHAVGPEGVVIAFLMNPNNPNGNLEMRAAQEANRDPLDRYDLADATTVH
jgi:hypothetical protein